MKTIPAVPILILCAAALAGGACQGSKQAPGATTSPVATAAKRYPLKGRVVKIDVPRQEVTIAHEEIPDYMPAMTMLFPIKGPAPYKALLPGALVSATFAVAGDEYWIEDVVVTKVAPDDAVNPTPPPAVEPSPGAALPDVALVNQDAKPIKLADFQGRALAITFIFTRCPLPEFCPRVTDGFEKVQALLAKQPALLAKTALLSVTFDTEFDTPKVLRAYGARHQQAAAGAAFSHWQLATGTPEEIKRLGTFFGLEYEEEGATFAHNLRTGVVRPDGTLFSVRRGSDWTPQEIVADLEKAAAAR
ncbi:MAG: SCO family protein [Vicinamibacteria bacterium]